MSLVARVKFYFLKGGRGKVDIVCNAHTCLSISWFHGKKECRLIGLMLTQAPQPLGRKAGNFIKVKGPHLSLSPLTPAENSQLVEKPVLYLNLMRSFRAHLPPCSYTRQCC